MLQQRQHMSAGNGSFSSSWWGSPDIAWVGSLRPDLCQLPKGLHCMAKARGWRLRLWVPPGQNEANMPSRGHEAVATSSLSFPPAPCPAITAQSSPKSCHSRRQDCRMMCLRRQRTAIYKQLRWQLSKPGRKTAKKGMEGCLEEKFPPGESPSGDQSLLCD